MKNFKKVLACVLSVLALSSIAIVPIESSAYYGIADEDLLYYQENAITEAIIVLKDAEEWSGTYYFINSLKNTPSIAIDVEKNLNGLYIEKIDDTIDISNVEKVLTFSYNNEKYDGYGLLIPYIDEYGYYGALRFNTVSGWYTLESTNINSSETTIGDSDQTIGDSKVTALRGDVNLDGDVNGLDLLYLKKYLLGLIEW